MKKNIPNILTSYRIIVALSIPILFYFDKYNILSILFVLALISDLFDGYFARKWNATSSLGAILDKISDKALGIISSITFIFFIDKYLILLLIGESLIVFGALFDDARKHAFKNKNYFKHNSSKLGKLKTWFLFITLGIAFISYKYVFLKDFLIYLVVITFFMQIITIIDYIFKYKD